MKKILVPIKRVPDYEVKLKVAPSGESVITDGIKWIVNPFDEIAVEEALRLKERGNECEIVVVSIGPEGASEQLRTALAMGADSAILVKCESAVDSHVAHEILAQLYSQDTYSLVIMGKQSIDSDANQTGQLLAAKLGLPQATFASKLELKSDWSEVQVTREVDGGLETLSVSLPAVVTTDLRLNEPRYPSLPGIVKAKKKPLNIVEASSLGVDLTPRIKIRKLETPAVRKAGVKLGSVVELVDKLRDEAKVL